MRPRSKLVLRGEGDEPYPEQGVSSCLGRKNDELADSDSRLNHMIPQSDPEDTPPIKNEIPSPPQTRKGMTHSSGKCERSFSSSPTILLSKREHPTWPHERMFSFAQEYSWGTTIRPFTLFGGVGPSFSHLGRGWDFGFDGRGVLGI